MSLREAHKRQIESIVRADKKSGNVEHMVLRLVVSRYPKTFEGADAAEAQKYYEEVWDEAS